jgi:argininosuccinate lyase
MAADICVFMNQNLAFLSFPDELTTGSSIMPHKKNPDVFELIRAKTNQIQATPNTISMILTNTTTGYHRDLQLLKEEIFPALETLKSCLSMTTFMLKSIKIKENILQDPFYKHLFSVEVVNELVLQGMPFRDAYKQVGNDIENGNFEPDQTKLNHTHEGSIGNLSLDAIQDKMDKAVNSFDFEKIDKAINRLLN